MIAPQAVIDWLKSTTATAADPELVLAVDATNDFVGKLPVTQGLAADAEWDDDVNLGAIMLASRYWRRRNSPNGVEAMTESGAAYVARHDSDISRLLKLDSFAPPAVG